MTPEGPYTLDAALDAAYECEHQLRAAWRGDFLDDLQHRRCTAAESVLIDAEVYENMAAIYQDRAVLASNGRGPTYCRPRSTPRARAR